VFEYTPTINQQLGQSLITPSPSLNIPNDNEPNNSTYFSMSTLDSMVGAGELQITHPPMGMSSLSHHGQVNEQMDFDPGVFPENSSLGDFLADIMMSTSPNDPMPQPNVTNFGFGLQPYSPRDVLDFGFTDNMDMNDFDIGLISSFHEPRALVPAAALVAEDPSYPPSRDPEDNTQHPGIDDVGIDAFKRSLWRWTPGKDERGVAEQMNLSLAEHEVQDAPAKGSAEPRLSSEKLDQTCRDRLMAMLFTACEPAAVPRIVSSFPSAELLDGLMQEFMSFHVSRPNAWIHLPTFRPRVADPELTGIIVAAGAVLSPLPAIRKLGFAIQEAVRLLMPKKVS